MKYTVKIGNDINTADIDAYYPLLDFGVYNAKDWEKVRAHSTFVFKFRIKVKLSVGADVLMMAPFV